MIGITEDACLISEANDQIDPERDQFAGECRKTFVTQLGPATLEDDVLALGIAHR